MYRKPGTKRREPTPEARLRVLMALDGYKKSKVTRTPTVIHLPELDSSAPARDLLMTDYLTALLQSDRTVADFTGTGFNEADLVLLEDVLTSHPTVNAMLLQNNYLSPLACQVVQRIAENNRNITFMQLPLTIPDEARRRILKAVNDNAMAKIRIESKLARKTKLRLEKELRQLHVHQLRETEDGETDERDAMRREEAATRSSMLQQKQLREKEIILEAKLQRRREIHRAQLAQLETQESDWRSQALEVEFQELLALCDLDASLVRIIIGNEAQVNRQRLKQAEKANWVFSKRAEKLRLEEEKRKREELQQDETDARKGISKEEDGCWPGFYAAEAAGKEEAHELERTRVDRLRREEAARKRAEDLAKEKKEKEERERQRLIREQALRFAQQRQRVDDDAKHCREAIMEAQSAVWETILSASSALTLYFASYHKFEGSLRQFHQLCREAPLIRWEPLSYIPIVYLNNTSATQVLDPKQEEYLTVKMRSGWETELTQSRGKTQTLLLESEDVRMHQLERLEEEIARRHAAVGSSATDSTSSHPASTFQLDSQQHMSSSQLATEGPISPSARAPDHGARTPRSAQLSPQSHHFAPPDRTGDPSEHIGEEACSVIDLLLRGAVDRLRMSGLQVLHSLPTILASKQRFTAMKLRIAVRLCDDDSGTSNQNLGPEGEGTTEILSTTSTAMQLTTESLRALRVNSGSEVLLPDPRHTPLLEFQRTALAHEVKRRAFVPEPGLGGAQSGLASVVDDEDEEEELEWYEQQSNALPSGSDVIAHQPHHTDDPLDHFAVGLREMQAILTARSDHPFGDEISPALRLVHAFLRSVCIDVRAKKLMGAAGKEYCVGFELRLQQCFSPLPVERCREVEIASSLGMSRVITVLPPVFVHSTQHRLHYIPGTAPEAFSVIRHPVVYAIPSMRSATDEIDELVTGSSAGMVRLATMDQLIGHTSSKRSGTAPWLPRTLCVDNIPMVKGFHGWKVKFQLERVDEDDFIILAVRKDSLWLEVGTQTSTSGHGHRPSLRPTSAGSAGPSQQRIMVNPTGFEPMELGLVVEGHLLDAKDATQQGLEGEGNGSKLARSGRELPSVLAATVLLTAKAISAPLLLFFLQSVRYYNVEPFPKEGERRLVVELIPPSDPLVPLMKASSLPSGTGANSFPARLQLSPYRHQLEINVVTTQHSARVVLPSGATPTAPPRYLMTSGASPSIPVLQRGAIIQMTDVVCFHKQLDGASALELTVNVREIRPSPLSPQRERGTTEPERPAKPCGKIVFGSSASRHFAIRSEKQAAYVPAEGPSVPSMIEEVVVSAEDTVVCSARIRLGSDAVAVLRGTTKGPSSSSDVDASPEVLECIRHICLGLCLQLQSSSADNDTVAEETKFEATFSLLSLPAGTESGQPETVLTFTQQFSVVVPEGSSGADGPKAKVRAPMGEEQLTPLSAFLPQEKILDQVKALNSAATCWQNCSLEIGVSFEHEAASDSSAASFRCGLELADPQNAGSRLRLEQASAHSSQSVSSSSPGLSQDTTSTKVVHPIFFDASPVGSVTPVLTDSTTLHVELHSPCLSAPITEVLNEVLTHTHLRLLAVEDPVTHRGPKDLNGTLTLRVCLAHGQKCVLSTIPLTLVGTKAFPSIMTEVAVPRAPLVQLPFSVDDSFPYLRFGLLQPDRTSDAWCRGETLDAEDYAAAKTIRALQWPHAAAGNQIGAEVEPKWKQVLTELEREVPYVDGGSLTWECSGPGLAALWLDHERASEGGLEVDEQRGEIRRIQSSSELEPAAGAANHIVAYFFIKAPASGEASKGTFTMDFPVHTPPVTTAKTLLCILHSLQWSVALPKEDATVHRSRSATIHHSLYLLETTSLRGYSLHQSVTLLPAPLAVRWGGPLDSNSNEFDTVKDNHYRRVFLACSDLNSGPQPTLQVEVCAPCNAFQLALELDPRQYFVAEDGDIISSSGSTIGCLTERVFSQPAGSDADSTAYLIHQSLKVGVVKDRPTGATVQHLCNVLRSLCVRRNPHAEDNMPSDTTISSPTTAPGAIPFLLGRTPGLSFVAYGR